MMSVIAGYNSYHLQECLGIPFSQGRATEQYTGVTGGCMIVARSTEILILVLPIALAVCAYLIAWRGKRQSIRKLGSIVVACLAAFFGWIGTFWYAIPALHDFHRTLVPLSSAILGNVIIWGLSIGAWVIAVRCAWFALRKNPSSPSP